MYNYCFIKADKLDVLEKENVELKCKHSKLKEELKCLKKDLLELQRKERKLRISRSKFIRFAKDNELNYII